MVISISLDSAQGSDTRVKKSIEKTSKKPASNLVMPVIVNDFFMFTASNDQQVMNLQTFE